MEEKKLFNLGYGATSKYKSIYRAYRRGHVAVNGMLIPQKPFNNRANTSNRSGVHSRRTNELKKMYYGQVLRYFKGA